MIYLPYEVLTLEGFIPVEHLNILRQKVAIYDENTDTFEYDYARSFVVTHSLTKATYFNKIILSTDHRVLTSSNPATWKLAGTAKYAMTRMCLPKERIGYQMPDAETKDLDMIKKVRYKHAWLTLLGNWLVCKTDVTSRGNVIYPISQDRRMSIENSLRDMRLQWTNTIDGIMFKYPMPPYKSIPQFVFLKCSKIECISLYDAILLDNIPLSPIMQRDLQQLAIHADRVPSAKKIEKTKDLLLPGFYACLETKTGAFIGKINNIPMILSNTPDLGHIPVRVGTNWTMLIFLFLTIGIILYFSIYVARYDKVPPYFTETIRLYIFVSAFLWVSKLLFTYKSSIRAFCSREKRCEESKNRANISPTSSDYGGDRSDYETNYQRLRDEDNC